MEKINIEKKYNKLLISKFNPKNGCYVDNGEYLILLPKKNLPLKDFVEHKFNGAINIKKSSKYGWVKNVTPFTLDEFIQNIKLDINKIDKQHLQIMLESIAFLSENTPVAVTYSQKSMFEKEMELKVHKVFFYNA